MSQWGAAARQGAAWVWGVAAVGCMGVAVAWYERGGAALGLAGTLGFGYLALRTGASALARERVADAEARLHRGDHLGARAALEGVPLRGAWASVQRAVFHVRGLAALYLGDFDAAQRALEASAASPGGPLDAEGADVLAAQTRGLLAFTAALRGDPGRARAEAQAARTHPARTPRALATATLGEALALWRTGDAVGARGLLGRRRDLVLRYSPAWLRAVARAMLTARPAGSGSAYRELPRTTDTAPSSRSAWLGRVLPGAALAEVTDAAEGAVLGPAEPLPVQTPSAAAIAAREVSVPFHERSSFRPLLLWAFLIAMFFTVWKAFSPPPVGESAEPALPPSADEPASPLLSSPFWMMQIGVVLLVGGVWYARLRSGRKRRLEEQGALVSAFEEGPQEVITLLTARVQRGGATQALTAAVELATVFIQLGRFGEAREHVEGALRRAASFGAEGVAWSVSPLFLRAFLEAAEGRALEARADLARAAQHAPRSRLELASVSVELALALRSGQREAAMRFALQLPDELELGLAEDVTCRVLRALAPEASWSDAELWSLHAELSEDAGTRAWHSALDPRLWRDFDALVRARMARGPNGGDGAHG
jgi:tetratricopeptide (TPR) repeat protein